MYSHLGGLMITGTATLFVGDGCYSCTYLMMTAAAGLFCLMIATAALFI
jgi:hypothetical protein